KNMRQTIVTMLILFLIIGCNQQEQSNSNKGLTINENGVPQYSDVKSGGVKMITVAGKYKVWTKKIGQGKIKVLLLHGGPGFTHDYFECFEDFLPAAGIEFYYYDQLGVGYSDI